MDPVARTVWTRKCIKQGPDKQKQDRHRRRHLQHHHHHHPGHDDHHDDHLNKGGHPTSTFCGSVCEGVNMALHLNARTHTYNAIDSFFELDGVTVTEVMIRMMMKNDYIKEFTSTQVSTSAGFEPPSSAERYLSIIVKYDIR